MNYRILHSACLLLCLSISATAQQSSNNSASTLSFSFGSGYTNPSSISKDSTLFGKGGLNFHVNADYIIGKFGLGISTGFLKNGFDINQLNNYLHSNNIQTDKLIINSNGAQSPFLLIGPVMRLGNQFQVELFAKGGIVFSSPSSFSVQQQGTIRPAIRIEPVSKNSFGWNAGSSFHYLLGNGFSLGVFANMMQFKTEVNRYDVRVLEGTVPSLVSNTISNLASGVSVRYSLVRNKQKQWSPANFRTTEGNDDGQTNRVLKSKTKSNQSNDRTTNTDDINIIEPERPAILKSKTKSNQSNDRTYQNCGPLTNKITHPDGTTEEQTFACPDDAVQYKSKINGQMPNRISMNVTVPKQTQGATFGEKVNQGLHAAGSALSQGTGARTIISGKIVITSSLPGSGIVSSAVSGLAGTGSGAAAASYAATGRMAGSNTPVIKGATVFLYAREASSGIATGRRQYQPVFFDGQTQEEVCNPCLATIKNPIYEDKGNNGQNPLYQGKRSAGGNDNDCNGTAEGFTVNLIDRTTGAVAATTVTNTCGEYWFANVPIGNYSVEVSGTYLSKKGYDYYQAKGDLNMAGKIVAPQETWQHIIYNNANRRGTGKVSMQDMHFVVADTDGDGMADVIRANATFSDGTVRDITEASNARSGGGTGKVSMQDMHFTITQTNQRSGGTGKVSMQDIHFTKRAGSNTYQATATFSNGKTQDISDYIDMQQSSGVVQFSVQVADVDGDGATDLIWSPRSNFCADANSSSVSRTSLPEEVFTPVDVVTSNMPMAVGDVDGDGINEVIVGNGASLLGGALPGGGIVSAALRPGNPIGGLNIKGGKNPGGLITSRQTNSYGQFEFTNLTEGNYTFTVETNYVLYDAVDIDWNGDADSTEQRKSGSTVKITATQNSQSLKTTTPKQTQGATFGEKVNAGLASVGSLIQTLDELDAQLQSNETPVTKASVSTSRSNIRNARSTLVAVQTDLQNGNIAAANEKLALLETQITQLQQSLNLLGKQYTTVSNVLKTKHDTAKNSVSNIR